jgi:hypothetical protein
MPWFLDSESRFRQLFFQQLVEQGQAPMAWSIATINNIITNTLGTIVSFSYTQKKEHIFSIFFCCSI